MWFYNLFLGSGVAHSIILVALAIALGLLLSRIKIAGISLGVTWILFVGIIASHFGLVLDSETSHFVKEFGEGFDRICREQEANGANVPSFRTDEFILKIMVPKVAEKVTVNVTEKVNATENVIDASQKTSQKTSQKIIDLIKEDPYISTSKMAEIIGVDRRNIARNIKKLQEQGVVRRVGPDKGGFWEVIV